MQLDQQQQHHHHNQVHCQRGGASVATSPDRSPLPSSRTERGARDAGYVMAMAGLIMVPLLLFAGFAADLGSWYYTGSQAQRAADAAALAGVVWLPDEDAAIEAAEQAAARNGFVDGVDGASVDIERIGGEQLRVTVARPVAQFFTQLVMDPFDMERAATAEYVLPVPLGSPTNTLGTGNLMSDPENFWLAVSGYCASKEQGDLLMPVSDANFTTGSNPPPSSGNPYASCTGGSTIENEDYDERGYWYAVRLPEDSSYDVRIEVYDASRRACYPSTTAAPWPGRGCRDGSAAYSTGDSGDGSSWSAGGSYGGVWSGGRQTTTSFVLHDQVVGFDYRDTPVLATLLAPNNSGPMQGRWTTVGTLARPAKGMYPIQVLTAAGEDGRASNSFAIRAVPVGAPSDFCTTIPTDPGYLSSCPQVHGIEWMSIMANLTDAASGTGQASFYLAQVADEHRGKKMEISLWDPGEGAQRIEVLDPNGNPVSFDWSTDCDGVTPPTGGCSGSGVSSLNVSGSGMLQPGARRASSSRYSDRLMRLVVDLPPDFSSYGGQEWWKIRYTVGGTPTDRTTWSVRILGDPVHLIPND